MTLLEANQRYRNHNGSTVIVTQAEWNALRNMVAVTKMQYGRWNGQLFGKKFVVKYGG